jgi:hypothetical protein
MDNNLYGKFSDIGLAQYKIRIGATPFVSNSGVLEKFDTNQTFNEDMLVFYSDSYETKSLDKALLITNLQDEEIKSKYSTFLSHPNFETQIIKY